MENLRRENRDTLTGGVLYTVTKSDSDKIRSGLISNISESGACIYTQECITYEKLRVYFKGLSLRPMNADVMWCVRSKEDLFKAGIQFKY